jgi:dipeptidyl-peptidase-4
MQIDLYDFATLKKLATLIDTKDHKGLPSIDGYTLI